MKRFSLIAVSLLLLAACNSTTAVTYELNFSVPDETLRQELIFQSMDVIERRLDTMGKKLLDKQVKFESGATLLTITTEDKETADTLTAQLTDPFTLDVMGEAPADQSDITVEGHGSFKKTGITGTDLSWVQARQQPDSTKGQVRLVFTPEGRVKMAALIKEMKGKAIGIFVRERLISKLNVQTDQLEDDIIISNIPDAQMADVFADDVNVGLHVTFTPLP